MGDINGAAPPRDGFFSQGGAQSCCLADPLPSQGTNTKSLCLLPLWNQISSQQLGSRWFGREKHLANISICRTQGFWPTTDWRLLGRRWDIPQTRAQLQRAQGNPPFIGNLTGAGKRNLDGSQCRSLAPAASRHLPMTGRGQQAASWKRAGARAGSLSSTHQDLCVLQTVVGESKTAPRIGWDAGADRAQPGRHGPTHDNGTGSLHAPWLRWAPASGSHRSVHKNHCCLPGSHMQPENSLLDFPWG